MNTCFEWLRALKGQCQQADGVLGALESQWETGQRRIREQADQQRGQARQRAARERSALQAAQRGCAARARQQVQEAQALEQEIADYGYRKYIARHGYGTPGPEALTIAQCWPMVNAVVNGAVPKFVSQALPGVQGARFAKIAAAVGRVRRQAHEALEQSQRQIGQRRGQIDARERADLARIDQRCAEQLRQAQRERQLGAERRLRALSIHLSALCAPGALFRGPTPRQEGGCCWQGRIPLGRMPLAEARDERVRALMRDKLGALLPEPGQAPVWISPATGASAVILSDARSAAERRKLSDWLAGLVPQFALLVRPDLFRVTVVDPQDMGAGYEALQGLEDEGGLSLVRDSAGVAAAIDGVFAGMIDVQRRFEGPEDDIVSVNRRARDMRPYRLLLVHGAENLSDETLLKLTRVLQKGGRCGVFCLATVNSAFLSAGRTGVATFIQQLRALEGSRIMLAACGQGGLRLTCNGVRFQPAAGMNGEACRAFAHAYRRLAASAARRALSLAQLLPGAPRTGDSSEGLSIPIGQGERETYALSLTGESAYALACGDVHSGKSGALAAVIFSGAMHYGPQELAIHILDLKQGDEFGSLAGRLPQVKVIVTDESGEVGLDYLNFLHQEILRRSACFQRAEAGGAGRIEKYEAYRRARRDHPELPPMPRILVIVDEFQTLFTGAQGGAAARLFRLILRKGRTYGVHILMASQQVRQVDAHNHFDATLKEFFPVRLLMRCSMSDARALMGDVCTDGRANPAVAQAPSLRTGQTLINPQRGAVSELNQLVQVGHCDGPSRQAVFQALADTPAWGPAPILMNNNHPARLGRPEADRLTRLARQGELVLGRSNRLCDDDLTGSEDALIDREGLVRLRLSRQVGEHVLIAGSDEKSVAALVRTLGRSFAAIDARPLILLPEGFHYPELTCALSTLRGRLCVGMEQIAPALAELAREPRAGFVLIPGLHLMGQLQHSGYGDPPEGTPAAHFMELLRQGSVQGLHLIAWHNNAARLNQSFSRPLLESAFSYRLATAGAPEQIAQAVFTSAGMAQGDACGAYMTSVDHTAKLLYANLTTGKRASFRPFILD